MRGSMRNALIALALSLPLAGCISFGDKPPPTLMTLSTAQPIGAGQAMTAREGTSVTVYVPTAPPELGGLRLPVKTGANGVAYLKDAQWADVPSRLFRTLLAETIRAAVARNASALRKVTMPEIEINIPISRA